MTELVPPPTAAAQLKVECAAHILIQASLSHSFPACKSDLEAGLAADNAIPPLKIANRLPLLAIDRNSPAQSSHAKRSRVATSISSTGSSLKRVITIPSSTLSFADQDSFENWAIKRLSASHPEAVIEKKRSAKTTTISCRNRRSVEAHGTACFWMLKATMKQDEDGPIRWEVGHNDQNHNQACLEQMNNKLKDRSEKNRQASVAPKAQPRKKRTIEISDESSSDIGSAGDSSEDEETPKELRKRKANHIGNALPSRARRYQRW